MNLESFISEMMKMTVMGRLWHWATDSAQHHVTYEKFLTQNEALTDSLMESAMGNDWELNFSQIGVQRAQLSEYSHSEAKQQLKTYRRMVEEARGVIEKANQEGGAELDTILDDVTELISKTIYLLKLQ